VASIHIPSGQPGEVRDAHGGRPARIADYPGAIGAAEAVFEVGSGSHEFTGPALPSSDS
jgi:hypothetical protein